jgi:hypothetical protein
LEVHSGHRQVDTDAISFRFGMKLTICRNGSAAKQMGGWPFTAAPLTDYRDRLESLDVRFQFAMLHRRIIVPSAQLAVDT